MAAPSAINEGMTLHIQYFDRVYLFRTLAEYQAIYTLEVQITVAKL